MMRRRISPRGNAVVPNACAKIVLTAGKGSAQGPYQSWEVEDEIGSLVIAHQSPLTDFRYGIASGCNGGNFLLSWWRA
jgi:hypothetical protein